MKLGPGGVQGQKNIFSNSFAFVLGSQKREFQEAKEHFFKCFRARKLRKRVVGVKKHVFQFFYFCAENSKNSF